MKKILSAFALLTVGGIVGAIVVTLSSLIYGPSPLVAAACVGVAVVGVVGLILSPEIDAVCRKLSLLWTVIQTRRAIGQVVNGLDDEDFEELARAAGRAGIEVTKEQGRVVIRGAEVRSRIRRIDIVCPKCRNVEVYAGRGDFVCDRCGERVEESACPRTNASGKR